MLESSSDWKGKGHSLGYCITTELQLWIKEHPAVPQVRKRESKRAGREQGAIDFNVPQVSLVSLYSKVQQLLCSLIQSVTRCKTHSEMLLPVACWPENEIMLEAVLPELFPLQSWDFHLSRSNHFDRALLLQPFQAGGSPTGTHIPAVRRSPVAEIYSVCSSSSANRSQLLQDCLIPAIWWECRKMGIACLFIS